ncbi:hypothetical protein GNI_029190 [Gregarina niphandrodes]|uniref:Uncharacterized protein n=1 Tax=Gregarina niphandrodes TaxID=110365 RepID=A0A023BB27_GRENI|nr:hypothetical protein GNI_029190 [Gregarina niphandrodes]EZG79145.1 hypothetical protein GNI_029190 [Gregarina niphandrodes]|eukprot:XP_011129125.1 hypothetical protein GNI_029190 [Gregarina niphandrodes]
MPVRLWVHQDMTVSFKWISNKPLEYIQGILTNLHDKIEDFDFGISLFWDRSEEICYVPVSELDGQEFEAKVQAASVIMAAHPASSHSSNDNAEDSLSALPMVAKHQFGSSPTEAVNIFVIITDDWGKYHGMPGCGPAEKKCNSFFDALSSGRLNDTVEDKVTCTYDDVWYPTIEQLSHSVETYNVVPITLVLEDFVDWWTDLWSNQLKLKADQGQYGVFPISMDAGGVAKTILESVNTVNCIIKTTTTKTPTSGTTTTGTSGTTGTSATSGTSVTTGTSATTTSIVPIITTTAVPGPAPDHNKAIAVGSAAAGAAALLAGAAWYKLRDSAPPELDVIEEEGGADAAQAGNRESIVAMEEDAYE